MLLGDLETGSMNIDLVLDAAISHLSTRDCPGEERLILTHLAQGLEALDKLQDHGLEI